MNSILATSSIDGRYKNITYILENYFSEYALFKYRVKVEIEYFIKLCNKLNIKSINENYLNQIKDKFNQEECLKIKQIETRINHDVKSVEMYIGNHFTENNHPHKNLIHFGLTLVPFLVIYPFLRILPFEHFFLSINIVYIFNIIYIILK